MPLQPGQHDRAAPADRVDRVADRLLRHRGEVEDHVDPVAAGQLADPLDRVLLVHVDGVVSAELARELELPGVAGQAGGDDQPGADVLGGEDRGQAALPGPEHQHRGPEVHPAVLQRPAHARPERVVHDRDLGRDVAPDRVHDRVRVQVHVLGVAAVEPEAALGRVVAAVAAGPVLALHVLPGQAQVAGPAGDEDLHRHPVADRDSPAGGGGRRDLLDDAERLMTGDHRQPAGAHRALVLLHVAAADAARLDPQQRAVVGADDRARELAQLHLPRSGLDDGANHVSHALLPCSGSAVPGRRYMTLGATGSA